MSQEKQTAEEVLQNATLLCKGTRLNKDGSEYKIMIKAMEEYATLKLQEKHKDQINNSMENYAVELLQNALNEELRHLATANEITAGNGFKFNNQTINAFSTSKRLAEERIPQLENALKKIMK